jgi:hypothetical protein
MLSLDDFFCGKATRLARGARRREWPIENIY